MSSITRHSLNSPRAALTMESFDGVSSPLHRRGYSGGDSSRALRRRMRTRRRLPPPFTSIAAVTFLLVGTALPILAVWQGWLLNSEATKVEKEAGYTFLTLGFLLFTPGSYSTFILFGAFRGWDGYDYQQVPSYD